MPRRPPAPTRGSPWCEMAYQVTQIDDRDEWDSALQTLPRPHALQSWDWGAFKERWGWQATRLLWQQEGQPVAAAQVLRRRLLHTPLSIMYAPKGPLLAYNDAALFDTVLCALEEEARRRRCLFVKIDPDVRLGIGTQESDPEPAAQAVLAALRRRGWRHSADQIQFRNTVLVDLTPDEQQLLARMKPKTRYNLRLAERRGVSIRRGSGDDLRAFYALYRETSRRDGFLIRPFAYYQDVWSLFLAAGRAHLLVAELGAEPIAGLMLFVFGHTAWYMYGASADTHRDLMPSHLLQWEAMRLARQLGCTCYDMWGAPDRFDESDRMWGVYRFKIGFGGETVRGLGAYDFTPAPGLYYFYCIAMPRLLALMRRRHRLEG